jgi:hypothetical protein
VAQGGRGGSRVGLAGKAPRSLPAPGIVPGARLSGPDALIRRHDRSPLPDGPARARSALLAPRRCLRDGARVDAGARAFQRPRRLDFGDHRRFLRTYNDGLDDDRRQDLYPVAAAIVGTAASRAVERERVNRGLAFAGDHGARLAGRRAALGLAAPGAAGAWAARAALDAGAHDEALSLVDELVGLGSRRSRWPRAADPARVIEEWTRT